MYRLARLSDYDYIRKCLDDGTNNNVFPSYSKYELRKALINGEPEFFIFYLGSEELGIGSIVLRHEIGKVFVEPRFRKIGAGDAISLWLKLQVIKKYRMLPISVVRDSNFWKNYMERQGMKYIITLSTTRRFILFDPIKFGLMCKKKRVHSIKEKK